MAVLSPQGTQNPLPLLYNYTGCAPDDDGEGEREERWGGGGRREGEGEGEGGLASTERRDREGEPGEVLQQG